VLFSEPKIPQCFRLASITLLSSVSVLFSEPKIPQSPALPASLRVKHSFSALQRAENSSMASRCRYDTHGASFQCSSASRKFLNFHRLDVVTDVIAVSVLFSEPKIPQFDAK